MNKKIILTFDLEFSYNGKFLEKYLPKDKKLLNDYVVESVLPLLELLDKHQQTVTFFVLGQVAEKYPEVVKKISSLGHEIASHGYSHKPLCRLNEKEFENEIKLSKKIIKKIINKEPIGFRAPNFSLNNKTKWALKILEKNNFKYDSSLNPLKVAFKAPYYISKNHKLIELPSFLGGIYFRILPLKLYSLIIRTAAFKKIPILYFHPYEFFSALPKIQSAPYCKKKIKYYGLKNAFRKFEKLIQNFESNSIEKTLSCK